MKSPLLLKFYIGFSFFYLLILLYNLENIAWYLKGLLIPILWLAVYFSEDFPSKKILLGALLFSWIGDVILLFANISEIYFILGLVAFLISHVIYIILFNKQNKPNVSKNKGVFFIGLGFILVYLTTMLTVLLPKLGDLQLPVIVYALTISTMLLYAFSGYLIWKKPANTYIFIGAIVFVLSDSILAMDKFYEPIYKNSFFIMLTYLMAQYLIVIGILKLNSVRTK
ncbi:lysoplasmalogenase [Flavobacterium sp. 140616W15]|uniref:lysoplasmalogenase n=1 Tax=Flavobacterium sp. 140616W15 TaxID=2478552 RepID=UPI000F0C4010|nr:lysoplasmalogenase [Flavobacterium sp. 140616W15]AYN03473.1 lysoplasmalogenase [Flavobacterium sp. 140616W15]